METGIVLALAYWGYRTGATTAARVLLAAGAPIVGFGFWSLVDFHRVGRMAEVLRLLQELAISALAATLLYLVGEQILGLALVTLSVVYHAMVYAGGQRLLKR